jgi:hypothetical protein
MDYWTEIEEYLKSSKGWISLNQIVNDTKIPEWVAEQWFKKIALNNRKYEIKFVLNNGNWEKMVRVNGKEKEKS